MRYFSSFLFSCFVFLIPSVTFGEGHFIAYSLHNAEEELKSGLPSSNTLQTLGGITSIAGMVFDQETQDLILVGQVNPSQPVITLDDLAIALKVTLLDKELPVVSLEPRSDTKKNGILDVYFSPRLANTPYGLDLLNADVSLKKLSLGILPANDSGVKSYFSLMLQGAERDDGDKVTGLRFWFEVIGQPEIMAKDGMVIIRRFQIGVEEQIVYAAINGVQVPNLEKVTNPEGRQFSHDMTERYLPLTLKYPEIGRVKTLLDLVAIAKGYEELRANFELPDLAYWLKEYQVTSMETPSSFPLLTKSAEFKDRNGRNKLIEISGGIRLGINSIRLKKGSGVAFKQAVLKSRPSQSTLTWRVPLNGWKIPGALPVAELPKSQKEKNQTDTSPGTFIEVQVRDKESPQLDLGIMVSPPKYKLDEIVFQQDTSSKGSLLGEYREQSTPGSERSNIRSYFTDEYPGKPKHQTYTEAKILPGLVPDAKRVVIFGESPAADVAYNEMVRKIGSRESVKRVHAIPPREERQKIARQFGADAILGVGLPLAPVPKTQVPLGNTFEDSMHRNPGHGSPSLPGPGANPVPQLPRSLAHQPKVDLVPELSSPTSVPPHIARLPRNPRELESVRQQANDIGGVMLQGPASILDNEKLFTTGKFSLIYQNGEAEINIGKLRKFVTALWAVYFSNEGPGISIDPIAPGIDQHLVRYIGHIVNSDLARVMREADYLMKQWAVGSARPQLVGFQNPDDIAGKRGKVPLKYWSRFWFVPEKMRFSKVGDVLLFKDGHMRLKTEYIGNHPAVKADPANVEFANYFTEHYEELSDQYPVFQELFEYAKLVSLGQLLKEEGIPLLWFLLANMDLVITEDSPGTVDALVKKSDYFHNMIIEGGVDLDIAPSSANYVFDDKAAQAVAQAFRRYGPKSSSNSRKRPSRSVSVTTGDQLYSVTEAKNLTLSGGVTAGDIYQTDFAFRKAGEPGLELVRFYNPDYEGFSSFGSGWHLMIPYRVYPKEIKKIQFLNALIPREIVVHNLMTGRKELLTFSKDRYSIAGYVPEDPDTTPIVGLFLLTDGTFRLADKLGNEFQFDAFGRLTDLMINKDFHMTFHYGRRKAGLEAFDVPPFQIVPLGSQRKEVANVSLPQRMLLVDTRLGEQETFEVSGKNSYNIVGYLPLDQNMSQYRALALMSDGSFLLEDRNGVKVTFDPGGRFHHLSMPVIDGVSLGSQHVVFDHEFEHNHFRIQEARLTGNGTSPTLYSVNYRYDENNRLIQVVSSGGEDAGITYSQERVILANK